MSFIITSLATVAILPEEACTKGKPSEISGPGRLSYSIIANSQPETRTLFYTKHRKIARQSRPLVVRRAPGRVVHRGLLHFNGMVFHCSLGRNGITSFKREGDGATPMATLNIHCGYARRDRLPLQAIFSWLRPIHRNSGWCDAPAAAVYNRPVRLPFRASHELMFRNDRLYDICLVLDWNLTKRSRFRGSAIFLHQTDPHRGPTEGCIALAPHSFRRILPFLQPNMRIKILG
jgi:L,D-peptidoglycan transpeptidase YkuD (ErfK/YbiS/YcfS/YnhG family)